MRPTALADSTTRAWSISDSVVTDDPADAGQGAAAEALARAGDQWLPGGGARLRVPGWPPDRPDTGDGRDSGDGQHDGPERGPRWRLQLANALQFAGRELAGDAMADEFGFDPDFNDRVLIPLARMLYRQWFRVQMRGLAHVPSEGPVLVVANHSGTLPVDAVMLQTGLHDEHPAHRSLRLLGADLVYQIPLLGTLARKSGHIRACPGNAQALLAAGKAVGVFPEGFKGVGKPFAERYRLQRFGRGGFAATAIQARAPIVPCAIVGAEEIYPMIGNASGLAQRLGLPYFPITPLFPWLGPLGAVPLPSRWIIEFCDPVDVSDYEPGAESDPAAVADLSGRVRGTVQRKLKGPVLAERGPAFG